jgi:TRAP-type C4-dicarboxylate transport system permease small subunit
VTYDLLARAAFIAGGAFACWAGYRTVRDNWTRIVEALRGQ